MQYLLYVLAFYVFLVVARYFQIFRQLLGLTLQYSQYEPKSDDQLPDYLRDVFKVAVQELEPFGFQFCCYMEVDCIVQDYWKRWDVLLYNNTFQTFAIAQISTVPDAVKLFTVSFDTFFEEGTFLLTVNGQAHSFIGEFPNTVLQDPYSNSLEEQWRVHQHKLEELSKFKSPEKMSVKAFITARESREAAYIDHLVASKQAVQRPGTALFNLTLVTAVKAAIKFGRGSAKYAASLKKQAVAAKTKPTAIALETPVEVEVEAFQRFERFQRRRARKEFKFWFLAGSLLLFVLAFTPLFDLQTLLILVGVLFLHEAGHFLAMRFCGYQDTSIFFLPLFGAAASGHKDNATLTEKVVVLLAGPLPGLLLGAGMGIAMGGQLYKSVGIFSIVGWLLFLNYFNLLPILPLDGGRILNLLVFSRHPYSDVLFKIFTVCFFVFIGITLGDPISLPLGVVIGITIPASFRSAKILKQLKQQLKQPAEATDSVLHSIFRTLKQMGYGSLPFIQKYRMVQDIAQRCNESQASLTTRLSLLGLYLFCVLGGLILIFLTLMPLHPGLKPFEV